MKIKIIGENFSVENEISHSEMIVDLSCEFFLTSREDKSNYNLKENDSLHIESNDDWMFVKKGTVKFEVIE